MGVSSLAGLSKKLSATFLLLMGSRLLGILRELIISAAFGFSKLTDLFYQSTFPLTCVQTVTNGPFTTAFGARLNQAPEASRLGHLRYYTHWCLWLGGALSVIFLLVSAGLYYTHTALTQGLLPGLWLAVLVLVPAAFNTLFAGYVYAVATAMGLITHAAWVLFINNALFVMAIILVWVFKIRLEDWTLPACYAAGTIFSLFTAQHILKLIETKLNHLAESPEKLPLPGLAKSFAYAGAETMGFIVTQSIVLSLASAAGTGWVSALSLTQRIALSINGFVINPMGSLLMLSVLNGKSPRTTYLKSIVGIFFGLILFSLIMVLCARFGLGVVVDAGYFQASSANILNELLPAYALWLLPLGVNIVVCKVAFGLGMDRTYTVLTLIGYVFANIARIWLSHEVGFVWAIAAGAIVEFIVVVILAILSLRKLSTRDTGA
jgi:peptidoglycan biosynthesis protein MviN/MurJ (putative lipid II flippase)